LFLNFILFYFILLSSENVDGSGFINSNSSSVDIKIFFGKNNNNNYNNKYSFHSRKSSVGSYDEKLNGGKREEKSGERDDVSVGATPSMVQFPEFGSRSHGGLSFFPAPLAPHQ
jgi:hypothetical protein